MSLLQYKLDSGTLSLIIKKQTMPFNDLVGVAERINPKRPFIFVSKVIGRYIPTSLKTLVKVSEQLANQIPVKDLQGNVSVISLSETALGLGALVHKTLNDKGIKNLNVMTTRHKSTLPSYCEFKETHSHLPNHYIYTSSPSVDQFLTDTEVLVLVDDEITTGNTLNNLYKSLNLKKVKKVILLSLTDWSNKSFDNWGVEVDKYSLIEGEYKWTANPDAVTKVLPYNAHSYSDSIVLDFKKNFRQPTFDLFKKRFKASDLKKDILVVYYNELLPYCLQKYLQYLDNEKDVFFLSLSSSPIDINTEIKSKVELSGFYSNIPVYLYNYREFLNSKNEDKITVTVVTEPYHIPFNHGNSNVVSSL